MAVGGAFSALEVVPLIVLGYEAWEHWSLRDRAPWMRPLRWPLMCFVAVAFWNMLGAGVFGFMINTPLALRSEEHTSELQSLMRISYAVFCLKKKKKKNITREC